MLNGIKAILYSILAGVLVIWIDSFIGIKLIPSAAIGFIKDNWYLGWIVALAISIFWYFDRKEKKEIVDEDIKNLMKNRSKAKKAIKLFRDFEKKWYLLCNIIEKCLDERYQKQNEGDYKGLREYFLKTYPKVQDYFHTFMTFIGAYGVSFTNYYQEGTLEKQLKELDRSYGLSYNGQKSNEHHEQLIKDMTKSKDFLTSIIGYLEKR
jgi:hypothetical protein